MYENVLDAKDIAINAIVPQVFILDSFLFLIYINDFSDNLLSNVNSFADDTSLFSVIHDINISVGEQWKVVFNPDASPKIKKNIHLALSLKLTHKNT